MRLHHSPGCGNGDDCPLCEARIDAREFDMDVEPDSFGWLSDLAAEREAERFERWAG